MITTKIKFLDIDKIKNKIVEFEQEFAQEFTYRLVLRSRVRTGLMSKSWEYNVAPSVIRFWNDVPYTVFNEFGTSRMSAQPMLRPTVAEAQQICDQVVAKL